MAISTLQAGKTACLLSGWTLTNFHLHKLLYNAHMVHMGQTKGEPLIEGEPFQAWCYGPVLSSLHHHCSCYGARMIKDIFSHIPSPDEESEEYKAIEGAILSLGGVEDHVLVEIIKEPISAWANTYGRGTYIRNDDFTKEYIRRFIIKR